MLSKSAIALTLGLIGTATAVAPSVPANWGASANFTSGMITIAPDLSVTGEVGAAVSIYDAYVCEEAQTVLATYDPAAPGPLAGVTIAGITGKAAKIGEECVTIQTYIEGETAYTAAIGNYGAEEVIDGKIITYPVVGEGDEKTANGVTVVSHTGNTLQFSIVSDGISSGNQYQVNLYTGSTCTGATPVNTQVTGSTLPVDDETALQAELDAGAFDAGTVDDDGTFIARLAGQPGTIATYANRAIGISLRQKPDPAVENAPDNLPTKLIMCGKIAYLPKVRGFVTAYNDASGSVAMKGWVSGIQQIQGLEGSFHVHAKPTDVDSGGYTGPNCNDKASIGDHFLSEDETDYWATATESLITYQADADGTAELNAPLVGVPISVEEIRYQAVVIHTEKSKDALEYELRVGCGTLGGVAPPSSGGSFIPGGNGGSGASAVVPSIVAVFTAMAAQFAF